ncbi:BON domain-containing protein [Pollutimonas bauzanensis]|uniref:Osmotically-inducible protein OsmY, contains BON domain n=1 Tax=Pollutimonas bauzanensis TaxID=658167 RepID=A0A1M5STP8_9BURK|nr:BON domain-containing protein [Pollutimonas bauzanensis]SHH41827.1 Osmotically-inducible protein OsmY, contains BON domain [Pollutimonas bauzanensis]
MKNDDRRRHGSPANYEPDRDFDDSFQDQRNPPGGRGNQPRHWQGRGTAGQGATGGPRDAGGTGGERVDFDRRSYGRGNQFGRAGEYGRGHEYSQGPRQGFSGDYDRSDDYGRGDERIRDEGHSGRAYPGARATGRGEVLRSRSADPGQSSYGGFSNEDPRFQRQQGAYGPRRIQPKGYTRSDERVREDICEQLSHSGLDVSDVSVSVAEGKVTLEGTVKDRRVKHAIEDYADDCIGVKDVDNRITVQRGDPDAGAMAL